MAQTALINNGLHIRVYPVDYYVFFVAKLSGLLPGEERTEYGDLFAAAPEMLAFIEALACGEFNTMASAMKAAFVVIKKVRG